MTKKLSVLKLGILLVLLSSILLFTGCSNNENNLPEVSNYDLSFIVLDQNDDPIEGTIVILGQEQKTTDSNGIVIFSKSEGSYTYTIEADGYDKISDTLIVDSNETSGETITIEKPLTLSIYNIVFTIRDENENPIKNVAVTISRKEKTTNGEGVVTFSRPNGTYDFNITIDSYDSVYNTIVIDDEDVSIKTSLSKTTYNINFTVLDENDNPIKEVTITLDDESKTTDINGMVAFNKTDGSYDYIISASGYIEKNNTIIVNGNNIDVEVPLILIIYDYNIRITVLDESNNPIYNAGVRLDGKLKYTNSNGVVIFSKPDAV